VRIFRGGGLACQASCAGADSQWVAQRSHVGYNGAKVAFAPRSVRGRRRAGRELDMPQEFDPYHRWLGIPAEEQPSDHYRLLGLVRFEEDREVIRDAAERQIGHVRRYGLKHPDVSQRILNELAMAKAVLLDSDEKSRYDVQLRRVSPLRPAPAETPATSRDGIRDKIGRWFQWVAARMAALLRRPAGKAPPAPAPVQPPPLPPAHVPPLPAGPADPRGPMPLLPARTGPREHQGTDRGDPFEKLRRTAIGSMEDHAPNDEPRPAAQEKTADRAREAAQDDETQVSQPRESLPTAILWILDDGRRTGQSVRMRKFPFLVGRTQGDVQIPHDPAIDDPHLEISWQEDAGAPQLVVRDLGSRGGMFVRAVKGRVRLGQEMRIGSGCYCLVEPSIVEEAWPHNGRRLAIGQAVAFLGRCLECEPLHMSQDRMADHRHAKMSQDDADGWSIEDQASLNGTWIRVPQIVVRARAEILIGEQRLVIDIARYARSRG
jgi:hypothetical protein